MFAVNVTELPKVGLLGLKLTVVAVEVGLIVPAPVTEAGSV